MKRIIEALKNWLKPDNADPDILPDVIGQEHPMYAVLMDAMLTGGGIYEENPHTGVISKVKDI